MKVLKIKERKDGGADVTVEISNEEEQLLIEYAINGILRDYAKRLEKERFSIVVDRMKEIEKEYLEKKKRTRNIKEKK